MNEKSYPRIGETVLEKTLPNGLKIFIVPKPQHRKKYAFFATRYGGMDMQFIRNGEKCDTPAGIAHYLEHKMFDTKDGNALQVLSQNGAEPNAFTSNAMTGYYFDCTEHFEENLRILLSFVSVPYFTDESVEKERGIIGQEIRMVEDSPDWQVYERLLACLYRSSPARVPIAGTVESIAGITAETLYDCHHAFYCPSNMALCVVGNVDPHTVIALAEEVLPRERGEEIARCYGEEEDDVAAQKETVTQMEVALPQFLVGFKCETNEGDLLRQSLIGEMASDVLLGDSSPLYQRLYDEGLINSSFGGGFDQLPGVAVLCAGGESGQPQEVSDAILGEAQRLARGLLRNACDLKQHAAGLDHRNPVFGRALTGTHSGLSGLGGYGLIGEDLDPDLTATLGVTGHGDTGRLDLVGGDPGRLLRLQAELTIGHLIAAQGLAGHTTALHSAVLHSFRHQH